MHRFICSLEVREFMNLLETQRVYNLFVLCLFTASWFSYTMLTCGEGVHEDFL